MTTTAKVVIAGVAAAGLYMVFGRNMGPARARPGDLPAPAPAKAQPQARDMQPAQRTYVGGAGGGAVGADQIIAGGAVVGDLLDRFGMFGATDEE